MAKTSVQKLIDQGDRMKNRLRRIDLDAKRGEGLMLGLAGTGVAVFADARFGEGAEDLEVAGIPITLAGSAALVALSVSRKVPKSDKILEFAKGPFYYSVGTFLRGKLEENEG